MKCVNCNNEFEPTKREAVCTDLCLDQAVEYDTILKEHGEDIANQHWCYLREKDHKNG